jgi:hypothetical protein
MVIKDPVASGLNDSSGVSGVEVIRLDDLCLDFRRECHSLIAYADILC